MIANPLIYEICLCFIRPVLIWKMSNVPAYAMTHLIEELRYKPEGDGIDSRWCHWNFSLTQSFRSHYGPGVHSAYNRNEYQEYILGSKGGRCHLHVPIVLESGSLNLLVPSVPVQACNGIALFCRFKRVFKQNITP